MNKADQEFTFYTKVKKYYSTIQIKKINLNDLTETQKERFRKCKTVEDVKNKIVEVFGASGDVSELEVIEDYWRNFFRKWASSFIQFKIQAKENSKYFEDAILIDCDK